LASIDENGNVKYIPRNIAEAQSSIPFTIATAIVKGDVFPDVLNDQTIKDQEILELSKKVMVKADPQKDLIMAKKGFPAADVEIFTEDGKVYKGCEPFVKGHPKNPMSLEECIQKFFRCVKLSAKAIKKRQLNNFIDQVSKIEELNDVRNLLGCLRS
jgi:2-methylcitrate dehydratase PrpD